MSRINNFRALGQHAWYKNLINKLSDKELIFCELFIEQTDHLDVSGYIRRVQSIPHQMKTKNTLLIEELLYISK